VPPLTIAASSPTGAQDPSKQEVHDEPTADASPGRFVETGPTRGVIRSPRHPYTQGLLASTVLGATRGQLLEAIPGLPPDVGEVATGCSFVPRCRHAEDRCAVTVPAQHVVAPNHMVRCVRVADRSLVDGSAMAEVLATHKKAP